MQRLETTIDLLDALMERYGWASDRQIAEGLEIPQPTISNWRRGRAYPTEVHAPVIAQALEIPPALVLVIAAADRSPDRKSREFWRAIVRQVAREGLGVLAAISVATALCVPQETRADASGVLRQMKRRAAPARSKAA